MARRKELLAAGVPCYVVQRGAGAQSVLHNDTDRIHCLAAFREAAASAGLRILGYCILPDRVHSVVIPRHPNSLAALSHPLLPERRHTVLFDGAAVWGAVARIELEPVRLGLVSRAFAWRWSSAAAHTGFRSADPLLDLDEWGKHWSRSSWSAELDLLEQALPAHPAPHLKENGISAAWPMFSRAPVTAAS